MNSLLIGVLFYVLRSRYAFNASTGASVLLLYATFAVLDLYWLPAIAVLDARLIISNRAITDPLGMSNEFAVVDLFGPKWIDIAVWLAQTLIATCIASKLESTRSQAT